MHNFPGMPLPPSQLCAHGTVTMQPYLPERTNATKGHPSFNAVVQLGPKPSGLSTEGMPALPLYRLDHKTLSGPSTHSPANWARRTAGQLDWTQNWQQSHGALKQIPSNGFSFVAWGSIQANQAPRPGREQYQTTNTGKDNYYSVYLKQVATGLNYSLSSQAMWGEALPTRRYKWPRYLPRFNIKCIHTQANSEAGKRAASFSSRRKGHSSRARCQ